jgi:hypothetical protein
MPIYVESGYGFGEAICKGRGFVRWGNEDDCDSVVFVTMFFIPFWPRKTIHTYNWNGMSCKACPIRWSNTLVLRAVLRRCLWGPLFVGLVLVILAGISLLDGREVAQRMRVILPLLSVPFLAVSGIGFWLLSKLDQRCRNIRWVLGPHNLGSSDPATWTQELQKTAPGPRELFGADSYAKAALLLLDAGEFARAMWAARFTVVFENRHGGEELTDSILQDANVRSAIARVRKNPQSWREVMNPGGSVAV